MQLRRLIASGLLLTVLLAPVLGLAVCVSRAPAGKACCMAHRAMKSHRAGLGDHAPASAPVAPCCERKAPMPALSDSSAQIVAPVQFALMPAVSADAMFPVVPVFRVYSIAAPPSLAPPLSLLCTLQI